MNNWIYIAIWVVAIGVPFFLLWKGGQVQRLAVYVQETREELKKCSWPSWEELKGSTVLISIMVALLGAFVVAVDALLFKTAFNPFLTALLAAGGYAVWHFVLSKRQQ